MDDSATAAITGSDLLAENWQQGPALGMALSLAGTLASAGASQEDVLIQLAHCRSNPEVFLDKGQWHELAEQLLLEKKRALTPSLAALGPPRSYPIWGASLIDPNAIAQMDVAMSLPVTTRGALLPDAHVGYGLPIGGVLETKNVVIPYAVGSDIACRMRLTVLDVEASAIEQDGDKLRSALLAGTVFGAGRENRRRIDSPVLEADWSATPLLRGLKPKAITQIGTSGSGNHFVEWGSIEWEGRELLALMSHSGSRGVGFKIAAYYSKMAEELRIHDLPKEAIRLSWLELSSEAGREYWQSMELAGQFARENHAVIHERVLGLAGVGHFINSAVENHHNFAWAEKAADGSTLVVHRKGATPAGEGVMGVIPGSMGAPGYVVSGKGNAESLESASHGAGRKMGRKQAERVLTLADRDRILSDRNVTLIGGGLDESPEAYKPIEDVLAAQVELVRVTAKFTPRIVRMDTGSQDI